VLLADDEPVNRLIAQTLLEEAGLRVTTVTNGEKPLPRPVTCDLPSS
jgi:CheY-like chemotaxis protein